MRQMFKRFSDGEDGAISVEWVVLTSALIALCALLTAILFDATGGLSQSLGETLANSAPG